MSNIVGKPVGRQSERMLAMKNETKRKGKILVLVESPAKGRIIQKYLGDEYLVMATYGHLFDLKKGKGGVDLETMNPNFSLVKVKGAARHWEEIRKAAMEASKILLATDADREGEGIAWHLARELSIPIDAPVRVVYYSVTPENIRWSFEHPGQIDQCLVDAYIVRRVLDRIVGYGLTEQLRKYVAKNTTGGRVQSAVLKMIDDRRVEIENHIQKVYWTMEGTITHSTGKVIRAYLLSEGKMATGDQVYIDQLVRKLDDALDESRPMGPAKLLVKDIKRRIIHKGPKPPFNTSTLQQIASTILGWPLDRIMNVAQKLYEGVDLGKDKGGPVGLITYMRTDSTRIAPEVVENLRSFIELRYGCEYLPKEPRHHESRPSKNQGKIQDAHEGIRPTSVERTPDSLRGLLNDEMMSLYKLIWERFVASEMVDSLEEGVTVELSIGEVKLRAVGTNLLFIGHLVLRDNAEVLHMVPELKIGEELELVRSNFEPLRHVMTGPSRYTFASLVKAMEEKGIGRPSTFASTVRTMLDRKYIVTDNKGLTETSIGISVNRFLTHQFLQIVESEYTANMEMELDLVEGCERGAKDLLSHYWSEFKGHLNECESKGAQDPERFRHQWDTSSERCEKCGGEMEIILGPYGLYLSCKNKHCQHRMSYREKIGVPCPLCGREILKMNNKRGRTYYKCSNPDGCDGIWWKKPTDRSCPCCGEMLIETKGGIICSKCKYNEAKLMEFE